MSDVTIQHIGLLKFIEEIEKAILNEALKMAILKLGWKHFQNSEGSF